MTLHNEVAAFIREREFIRQRKEMGDPAPWSEDWIFNTYRFCNVRREDDKVTRWLAKNWCDPHIGHPNMVAAMILARMVNWPPTLAVIGFPEKWDTEEIIYRIQSVASTGKKTWSGAYIVSTCGQVIDKARYVVETIAAVGLGAAYHPRIGDTLAAAWTRLCRIPGMGAGFLAAQVVADLKYCDSYLLMAEDWWTWAASGPGSRRGLNRYFSAAPDSKWGENQWLDHLHRMIAKVTPLLPPDMGRIHAQDYQNVMCEFDKYRRVLEKQGRPRSKYKPDNSYEV